MVTIALKLADGKHVGKVENGVAVIHVMCSRHFFRRHRGYTLDEGILDQIEAAGVSRIEFIDDETGEISVASPSDFRRRGIPLDYGFGRKLCLSERFYLGPDRIQGELFPAPEILQGTRHVT